MPWIVTNHDEERPELVLPLSDGRKFTVYVNFRRPLVFGPARKARPYRLDSLDFRSPDGVRTFIDRGVLGLLRGNTSFNKKIDTLLKKLNERKAGDQ